MAKILGVCYNFLVSWILLIKWMVCVCVSIIIHIGNSELLVLLQKCLGHWPVITEVINSMRYHVSSSGSHHPESSPHHLIIPP
jgi:hypothetical protein